MGVPILLYLLVLCVSNSAGYFKAPVWVTPATDVLSISSFGDSLCYSSLAMLRDTSTECYIRYTIDADTTYAGNASAGEPASMRSCVASLRGARKFACAQPGVCFASHPLPAIRVVNSFGSIQLSFGMAVLSNPTGIAVETVSTSPLTYHVYVVDTGNSAVWRFTWYNITTAAETVRLATLPQSGTGGHIAVTPDGIYVALYDTPLIYHFDKEGNLTRNFTTQTQGTITSISSDHAGKLFVYDSTSTLSLYKGQVLVNQSSVNLVAIGHSNLGFFVADNTNVYFYKEVMEVLPVINNVTCLSKGGSVSVQASGGVAPYSYGLFPARQIINTSSIANFNTLPVRRAGAKIVIYDDKIQGLFTDTSVNVNGNPYTPEFRITPHSGSLSFSFNPSGSGSRFSLSAAYIDYIQPSIFSGIEVWINPGSGGQRLVIAMILSDDTYFPLYTVRNDNYPPNTWTKLHYSFMYNVPAITGFAGFAIYDESPIGVNSNTFYIDDLVLLPYEYDYGVHIVDMCGQELSHSFSIDYVGDFEVGFSSDAPTCAGNSDGKLRAVVNGGRLPYAGNTISQSSEISGLPELGDNVILLQGGVLHPEWVIEGTANYTICDPTYHHSSFCPLSTRASGTQYIQFTKPNGIDSNTYASIQFWVNGGAVGGQSISLSVVRDQYAINIVPLTQLLFLPEVPPNIWIKVVYDLSPLFGVSYSSFVITSTASADVAQPTIYFSEITLVNNDNLLTVTDDEGCVASTYVEVKPPEIIDFVVTSTNVKCHGNTDGTMSIRATGGTAPYQYGWPNYDQSSFIATGLPANDTTISVADRYSCFAPKQATASILQPPALSAAFPLVRPPKCYADTASITATAVGGVGPYSYRWTFSDAAGSIELQNQAAPKLVYEDSFASGFSATINGVEYSPSTSSSSNSSLGCPRLPVQPYAGYCAMSFAPLSFHSVSFGCTGCIDFRTDTGVEFYVYLENPADAQHIFMTLLINDITLVEPLSIYNVTENGEIPTKTWFRVFYDFSSINLFNVGKFSIYSNNTNQGTVYLDSFVITVRQNGVVGWASGSNVTRGYNSIAVGPAGTYFLTITDTNGCEATVRVPIPEPIALVFVNNEVSTEYSNGIVDMEVTGGTPPYVYYLRDTNTSVTPSTSIEPGVHVLVVQDANGCTAEKPIEILKLNGYGSGLVVGLAAVVSIGLLIFIFAALILTVYWVKFAANGSFYSAVLLAGVLVSLLSAILLLPTPTDELCVSFVWLIGIGFILVYGCLFIKTWGLYKVWRNAIKYKRTNMTPMYIMKVLGVALLIEIVFLIIWTVVDPPHVVHVKMVNDTLEKQCDTDTPAFWVVFLTVKGIWLIFGAVLCILTRNIMKEHNESMNIAYAIYNNVVLCIIAVPLAILLKEVPGGRLVIMVAVIVLAFTFTMVIMFFKIWHRVLTPELDILGKAISGSSKSRSTRESQHSGRSVNSASARSTSSSSTAIEMTASQRPISVEIVHI